MMIDEMRRRYWVRIDERNWNMSFVSR